MLCAPSSMQRYMDQGDRTSGLGGTSTSLSLFFFVFKAPYSVYRNRHLYIFIRSKISTKSAVFELLCKNRKCWSRSVSGEKLCAPSSIQRYMCESDRTSGLGGTSTNLSFLSARILLTLTGYSFLDIAIKLCRRIALGEE